MQNAWSIDKFANVFVAIKWHLSHPTELRWPKNLSTVRLTLDTFLLNWMCLDVRFQTCLVVLPASFSVDMYCHQNT